MCSIFLGMKNRKYILLSAHSNITALLANDNEYHKASTDKHIVYKRIMKTVEDNSKKAQSCFELQNTSFIIGTLIFSVWHILQIFSN